MNERNNPTDQGSMVVSSIASVKIQTIDSIERKKKIYKHGYICMYFICENIYIYTLFVPCTIARENETSNGQCCSHVHINGNSNIKYLCNVLAATVTATTLSPNSNEISV